MSLLYHININIKDACILHFLCSLILVHICLELRTCTICTSPARTSSLETSVFPCKAESVQSCTEASVSHRTHTDKSTAHPPLTKHACLHESPVCVQLANTYSQTGEAPWLSRVSVSMSVLMAVADLTQALLTDRGLLYTLPPPSCPSLIFKPPLSPSNWMVKRCEMVRILHVPITFFNCITNRLQPVVLNI